MTKSDLIKKIAALSGVSDSGAKIFFEMFIKELSDFLSAGESLKIKNLGYFSLKKGKIKKSDEEKEIDSDIIIFSESENILKNNYLFFLVPVHKEDEHSSAESYFNLSLNKVTVSPEDIITNDIIIPPDDHELKNILTDKVLNLLIENEKVKLQGKGPELNINEEFKDELEKPEVNQVDKVDISEDNVIEISEDLANIPFDMGKDLNLLKDEHLNIQNELSNLEISNPKNEEIDDWKIEKPDTENLPPDLLEEDEFEKLMKEENLYNSIDDSPDETIAEEFFDEKNNELKEETKIDYLNENYLPEEERRRRKLERLKEAGIEPIETWNVEKVLGEIDKAELSSAEISDKGQEKEEKPEVHIEKNLQETIPEKKDNLITNIPEKKNIETDKKFISKNKPAAKSIDRKKPKKNIIIQLIFLIAIFAAAFYYYFNFVAVNKGVTNIAIVDSDPLIIEREYEIPVTYPYDEERINKMNPVNPVEAGIFITKNEKKNSVLSSDTIDQNTTAQNNGRTIRVKRHIYKLNDEYLVQIASWYNRIKAEEQAAMFAKKGYSTKVKEDVAAGDPVFVVIVDQFKTLEEAEEFYNKNQ